MSDPDRLSLIEKHLDIVLEASRALRHALEGCRASYVLGHIDPGPREARLAEASKNMQAKIMIMHEELFPVMSFEGEPPYYLATLLDRAEKAEAERDELQAKIAQDALLRIE